MGVNRKLAILIAIFALAPAPARALGDIPPGFIGISPQSASKASDFELMGKAGISSARLLLHWPTVQAKTPYLADPDWRWFDHDVAIAAREGIRVLAVVYGTPGWAAPEPNVLPVARPLQRWSWAALLRGAAERYGRDGEFWDENPELPYLPVTHWEIWNEPNIVSFDAKPSPARFATLLRISGRSLKRVDPRAQVIAGGFFGRPLQIPPNVGIGTYLRGIYRAGKVKPWFDGVGLHPYVADARAIAGQMRTLRRVMRAHHDARTPIYVTELGWGSAPGPSRWERGLAGQARQLDRALRLISANRQRWRVRGVWWYSWSDEGGNCIFCASAGLLTADRKAKPAWYRFNAWTGGDPSVVPRAGTR